MVGGVRSCRKLLVRDVWDVGRWEREIRNLKH